MSSSILGTGNTSVSHIFSLHSSGEKNTKKILKNEYIIYGGEDCYFHQGNGIQLDPSVDYSRPLKEILESLWGGET